MIIISKIVGIDNKFGRKSRTGSNISIGVKDEVAHDAQTYLMALEKDGELTGKIKKIELVIYEDGDELETIESLRAENKGMREFIDNLDTVVKNSESLIDSVVIEEEIVISDKVLLTPCHSCDRKPEAGNCNLQCSVITENPEDINLFEERENLPPNQRYLKLYDKPCECETPAIVSGKCANCGGVE